MRWNPRISVYWPWLVIVFGAIAALPFHAGETRLFILATVYDRSEIFDHWQVLLLVHTLVALAVAIPAAARHTIVRRRRGLAEPVGFSLRQLLAGTAILAMVFAFLAWRAAPPVLYCVAVLFYGGWPATLILAGLFESRVRAEPPDEKLANPLP